VRKAPAIQTIGSNGASRRTTSGASASTVSSAGQTYSTPSTTARASHLLRVSRSNVRMRRSSASMSTGSMAASWRSDAFGNGA